jgi:hypothetical protein
MMSGLLVLASAAPVYAQAAKPADAKAAPAAAKPADAKPAPAAAKPADKPAGGDAKPADKAADKPAEKPKKALTETQKKDAAKKAFKSGDEKFDKGEFEAALALYKEADDLVPGVTPKYKAAVSLDKLARVVDAVAAYQMYLDAKPDPVKYKDKIAEVEARIADLKKTPAKVKVVTVPPEVPGLKITVDGAPATGNELSLVPGKHTITASGDNFETSTEEVDASFAESRDLTLTLTEKKAEPIAAVPPPPPPVVEKPKPPEPVTPPPAPRSKVPAYVTLGLAGAGAVVGTIFGVQALSAKSAYNDDPTTDNADKTDRNALIADMSFAVALTFGVTGAVLLFSKDETEAKPAASRTIIAPWASPTGGGAVARFHF